MQNMLLDVAMADREVKRRMRAAELMAEKDRMLSEIGYSSRAEFVRLTVMLIALGLFGALVLVGI